MTARTHTLAAITAYAAVVLAAPVRPISLATVLAILLANQLGGIAPDIDQPTAPFWRNLPVGKYFGRIIDRLLGGHRFITHSLLGLAIFGFAAHWLIRLLQPIMPHINGGYVWWAFMIGMVSHLIMDSLTKEGVPLLLPIPLKFGFPPLKKFRITTGKWGETAIFLLLIGFDIWYGARHYTYIHQVFLSIY